MFLFSFDCLFLLNHSDLMESGTMNLFCSMFYFGLCFIQKWNKSQTQIQLRKLCLFLLLNWKKKGEKKKRKKKTTHPLLSIKKRINTKEKSSHFSTLDPQESKRKDPDYTSCDEFDLTTDSNKYLCRGGSFRIPYQCSEVKWLLKELYGCWNKELFI